MRPRGGDPAALDPPSPPCLCHTHPRARFSRRFYLLSLFPSLSLCFVEHYAETLVLWQRELDVLIPQVLSCTNTNAELGGAGAGARQPPPAAAAPAATAAQLTSLRAQHALDAALHDFARGRFEERWRQRLGSPLLSEPAATLTCATNPEGCLSTRTQLSVAPTAIGSGLDEVVCWRRCSVHHSSHHSTVSYGSSVDIAS